MWAFVVDNKPAVAEDADSAASIASVHVFVYLAWYNSFNHRFLSRMELALLYLRNYYACNGKKIIINYDKSD